MFICCCCSNDHDVDDAGNCNDENDEYKYNNNNNNKDLKPCLQHPLHTSHHYFLGTTTPATTHLKQHQVARTARIKHFRSKRSTKTTHSHTDRRLEKHTHTTTMILFYYNFCVFFFVCFAAAKP